MRIRVLTPESCLDKNALEHGAANNQRHEPYAHPDDEDPRPHDSAAACRALDALIAAAESGPLSDYQAERARFAAWQGVGISAGGPYEGGVVPSTQSAGFLGAVFDGSQLKIT